MLLIWFLGQYLSHTDLKPLILKLSTKQSYRHYVRLNVPARFSLSAVLKNINNFHASFFLR